MNMSKSHKGCSLDTLFKKHEEKKKIKYNDRVIKVEHGSFTPVVLSAYGGYGRETSCFVSKLIEKIAEKQDTERSVVWWQTTFVVRFLTNWSGRKWSAYEDPDQERKFKWI